IDEILEYDGIQLQLISGFLGAEVLVSLKHLRSLVAETVTRTALDTQDPAQLRLLEGSFLTLSQRNPLYQQVRWIDESGMERVRITRDNGEPHIVAVGELQNKRDRYYFEKANRLLPGELYISRIDLNEERGEVEMPPRPVLRIATPVANSQRERRGIIIINIEMRYMFEFVRGMRQKDLDVQYLLINQQGILLNVDVVNALAPDGEKEGIDFAVSHPDVWEQVDLNDEGSLESTDGLWSWRKLSPVERFKRLNRQFPEHLVAFDQMIADDFSVMLMAHRPVGTLEAVRQENRMLVFLGVFMVLSVYGLTLFFYLSGQARMRRAEVEAAYAQERASNLERLKELEQRFHLLVEASSIGQLVVDADGRIEISNPAAEQMLGYEKGELEGVSVDTLLPENMRQRHRELREEFMQMPVGRQMGAGRRLQAVRKDGSTIPVEVGLNPYSDHGRPLVLASVIDVSQR
ncbi:MAG: PAS domain S-box protein, partial [Thiohalobacterales bacterium]|nr:PAS domain S-box protein [Thiohalobacterales bacterium]